MTRSFVILFAAMLMLSAGAPTSSSRAQEARNVTEFCGVWQGVCRRTCPTTTTSCRDECSSRAAECRANGCFRFTRAATRCFNNAADRALTDAKLAPDPEAERARRARQK